MQTANQVAVVDMSQIKVVRTVPVGADPVQILVRPGVAYVSWTADGKVAVINLENWKVETMIETAAGADGLAWSEREP